MAINEVQMPLVYDLEPGMKRFDCRGTEFGYVMAVPHVFAANMRHRPANSCSGRMRCARDGLSAMLSSRAASSVGRRLSAMAAGYTSWRLAKAVALTFSVLAGLYAAALLLLLL